MVRKILIIGCGAAGFSAAQQALRINPKAEINIIEKRSYDIYRPCGIPFVLEGVIDGFDPLVTSIKTDIEGLNVMRRTEVTKINRQTKTVEVKHLDTNEREIIGYDKLIIATGAYPFVPPILGKDKKGIFKIKTIEDGKVILQAMKNARSAVVVGGGPLGLEVATALHKNGLKTHIVEASPNVLPLALDGDMAKIVEDRFREIGVNVHKGITINEVKGDDSVKAVVVGKEEIEAELIVVATGVRPDVGLARDAGIMIGETGGIRVDPAMRTNDPDIYAAGDCAEVVNLVTKRPCLPFLASVAVHQGKVAGANAADGHAVYDGTINTFVAVVAGLEVAGAGVTERSALENGIDVVSAKVTGLTKPSYYPGSEAVTIKVVARAYDGRFVGAQVVGGEGAGLRLNVLALAILEGLTVEQAASIELAYSPPVCDATDPIIEAADYAISMLSRKRFEERRLKYS